MKKRCTYTIAAALLLIFYKPASAQRTGGNVQRLSLNEVWAKAVAYNKQLQIKKQEVESSKEEVKDARAERLPEIQVGGDYARVSNMPIFENGLLHTPSQYPVLHSTYGLDGDAYLNIYSGNKTNLHIAQKQTLEAEKQIQVAQTQAQVKLEAAVHYLELQKSLIFKQLLQSDIAAQQKQLDKIEQLQKTAWCLKVMYCVPACNYRVSNYR